MKTFAIVGLSLLVGWVLVGTAAEPVAAYLTAPRLEQSPMDTTLDDNYFQDSPPLVVRSAAQVVSHPGDSEITGNDFGARVRAAWTDRGLFLRIDMRDDYFDPGREAPLNMIGGDYIRIVLRHQTAGPDPSIDVAAWNVILMPNPAAGEVVAFAKPGEGPTPRPLGAVVAKILQQPTEANAYSVLVHVDSSQWPDRPRAGAYTWLQIIWHDSDPRVDGPSRSASYCLFPARNDQTAVADSAGRLQYVNAAWVSVVPTAPIFTGNTVKFRLNYGNLELTPMRGEVYLFDRQQDAPVAGIRHDFTLNEGGIENNVPVELDVSDLEAGLFEVRARASRPDGGIVLSPGLLVVQRAKDLSVFPQLVELKDNNEKAPRPLAAAKDVNLALRTTERLAGAGHVLWQAGVYDASYAEFSGAVRGPGPTTVQVPGANSRNIPWALWGGRDALDGYGEPIVLEIAPKLFQGSNIAPDLPDFAYLQNDLEAKRAANAATRLLLIGLIQDEVPIGGVPEIVVKVDGKTIAQETFRPPQPGDTGGRHVYVMRVWLRPGQRRLSIENPARYAPKLKLDFLALLDGAPGTEPPTPEPTLAFAGPGPANIFNREVQTGLHLLQYYLVDQSFQVHHALPGSTPAPLGQTDFAMAMNELAAWGRLTEASQLAQYASVRRFGSPYGTRTTVGVPATVVGLYNVWRRRGQDNDFVNRLWLPVVHRPITQLENEIAANALGLANNVGEFGVPASGRGGTTLPMYFATQAAFDAAEKMARTMGKGQGTGSWRTTSERLANSFSQHFVAPLGGVGVRGHLFAGAVPEKAWIYARYEDGQPIGAFDQQRVFDSPEVFAGLYFRFDYSGFAVDPKIRQQLDATLTWLLTTSPVFQGSSYAKYRAISSTPACAQLWTATAAMLTGNHALASDLIRGYVAYNYDEFQHLAFLGAGNNSATEVSAYTWEEKMNLGPNGENLGPTLDGLTVLSATTGLKTARFLAGIDDYDDEVLKLVPHLPANWSRVTATQWPVVHDYVNGRRTTIDYSYERLQDGSYLLVLKSADRLDRVDVRIGPFDLGKSRINVNANGEQRSVRADRFGDGMYIEQSFRKVSSITFAANPAF